MQDNEEELRINSEIIWNFDDVNKELISAYPNGKSITECLVTIDGLYTWEIEFFPNGKDLESLNHLYLPRQNSSSVFPSRQDLKCQVWKKTVLNNIAHGAETTNKKIFSQKRRHVVQLTTKKLYVTQPIRT